MCASTSRFMDGMAGWEDTDDRGSVMTKFMERNRVEWLFLEGEGTWVNTAEVMFSEDGNFPDEQCD